MSIISRLGNLLRHRELSDALDEELKYHLEARIRDNINAGMSPEEARTDAVRRFGNQTSVKERTRDMDIVTSVETLWQDLCYAVRLLRKSPGFALVAVLALALGIGANTAVFTVVNGVLLRPLPFPDADRLFLISYEPRHSPLPILYGLTDRHYLEFERMQHMFEHVASFQPEEMTLTGAGDPVRLPAATVTMDFLRVLGVSPVLGRTFLSSEDQPGRDDVVLLSDKLWRDRFGSDPHVLGKRVTVDGVPHTVIGVMPAGFAFPSQAQLWTPLSIRIDPHNSFMRVVVGKLKSGASRQQAQAEFKSIAARLPVIPGEDRADFAARILPLKELLVADVRTSLLIFAGAVAFVLLIACANVANLFLIRATARRHEIAVRAALGAGRWRLIRQLLTESTLMSLCGGAAGLLLALCGVPALLAIAPAGRIPRTENIHIDGWVLAFTLVVSVVTGIVFGLAPAIEASRRELRESIGQTVRTISTGNEGVRSALVVAEIAIALLLLTGAGLMLKSFMRMRAVNPGFRAQSVLTTTVDLPDSVYRDAMQMKMFQERALARLVDIRGVDTVATVNLLPLSGMLIQGDFQVEGGRKLPQGYMVDKLCVSPHYFRALGIRLLRGRDFTEHDNAQSAGVVVVSQSVARQVWPGQDPIGKRISMEDHPKAGDWLTVVGIVDDVRQHGLTQQPSGATYQPYLQLSSPFFLSHLTFIVRTSANASRVAAGMRNAIREVDRNLPVESIITMTDVIAMATAEPGFQARLLATFSTLALILSAVGIYAVLACAVTERTKEIGIRMALGAENGNVIRMVLKRTLVLALAGVVLGTAGALAVTGVLGKFLFDVKPTDPATFVAVAALLAVVAVLAGLVPARRATKVDPVVALRYE